MHPIKISLMNAPPINHCNYCLFLITSGYIADLDLRHLQYFVAAAESRGFVKAAKLMNVSQPAITKSIQRFEKWFGHPVFERGAELRLTETMLRSDPYASRLVVVDFIGARPSSNPGIVTLKKRELPPVARLLMDEIAAVAEGC